jgi:hypothetical protein
MGDAGLGGLSLDDLRKQRSIARRRAEVAHLRARQGGVPDSDVLAELDAEVTSLTDELIARYAKDLSLVDSLLAPAYPAGVSPHAQARP